MEEALAAQTAGPQPGAAASPELDFAGDPEAVAAVAEAWRLAYGHQFNPAFASETARIDPLPHQRVAVYERMLRQEPLRVLLADDAGAGKTIMTGLYVREMLSRGRIRRVLIVPPAGLIGNWERELRTLFGLRFRIAAGAGNPFRGAEGDRVIVSLDTLTGERAFGALREPAAAPYDLVVFDEAHKLSATAEGGRIRKRRRYELAEALAGCAAPDSRFAGLGWAARHLLLLTATPHMGKDSPYHFLWRLLEPQVFATGEAFRRFPAEQRHRHFIRRTKEQMIGLDGAPLYRRRTCDTFSYDLSGGPDGEQALYDRTTAYLTDTYGRALSNRPAVRLAMSVARARGAGGALPPAGRRPLSGRQTPPGEGINLQFCRLMVNYDIPWNPARLEQRMGRIHRYGQRHDVRIVNLIAGKTREGRVLGVLLDKLDTIRRDLDSDKVFDVIGRLFENASLREYLIAALTDPGGAADRIPRRGCGTSATGSGRSTAPRSRRMTGSARCGRRWNASAICVCCPATCGVSWRRRPGCWTWRFTATWIGSLRSSRAGRARSTGCWPRWRRIRRRRGSG